MNISFHGKTLYKMNNATEAKKHADWHNLQDKPTTAMVPFSKGEDAFVVVITNDDYYDTKSTKPGQDFNIYSEKVNSILSKGNASLRDMNKASIQVGKEMAEGLEPKIWIA